MTTARKPAVKPAPRGLLTTADVLPAGRWVRLSDPEMKPEMDALKERIKTEPGYGLKLLQQAGIVNSKGKLNKLYGG